MRRALWGLWIVAWATLANAGPASGPPARPARPGQSPDQIELTQLERDFTQAQIKQRRDEAVKLARKIYDLTVKMHGADSPLVHSRKLALAGALSLNSDFREARKIYAELPDRSRDQARCAIARSPDRAHAADQPRHPAAALR